MIALSACSVHRDPQAVFDHAIRTFVRGDLAHAQEEAERGYKEFHSKSPDWAWKFLILEANVLCWRGMSDRALALLTSEPTLPSSAEQAIQRLRLEGLAYATQHRFPEAEQKVGDAERLCAASDSVACGEVVRTRARVEMERGHFAQGQSY